jgi:hypothetical protein
MKTSQVPARVFGGALVFALGGCATAAPSISTGWNEELFQVGSAQTFVLPASKSKTYQWLDQGMAADQYDYPKSNAPTRKKVDLYDSSGECSTGKGTFWIVDLEGETADEYTYDGKYIRSLSPSGSNFFNKCAVSAKTGDVALTASHEIVVFTGGSQTKAKTYSVSESPFYAGYDPKGNLYIDAVSTKDEFLLLELTVRSSSFQTVSLPNKLSSVGSVQWDGDYVAAYDRVARKIYRYAIAGYVATLEGTVTLKHASNCRATWIAPPYVFCPTVGAGKHAAAVFNYPAGGHSIATFAGGPGSAIIQVSE